MGKYAKVKLGKGELAFAHATSVYRAMISVGSNPLLTQANTRLVYEALKGLDLYVVVDFWKTPSVELADFVFPAACWIERAVLHTWSDTFGFVDCGEQAMPGQVPGECDRRPDYDLFRGLGLRLGEEGFWPWATLEEVFDYRLSPMGFNFQGLVTKGGFAAWPKKEKKMDGGILRCRERNHGSTGYGSQTSTLWWMMSLSTATL
jgi:anaerobic selenocysteine-containing dehydrogenase